MARPTFKPLSILTLILLSSVITISVSVDVLSQSPSSTSSTSSTSSSSIVTSNKNVGYIPQSTTASMAYFYGNTNTGTNYGANDNLRDQLRKKLMSALSKNQNIATITTTAVPSVSSSPTASVSYIAPINSNTASTNPIPSLSIDQASSIAAIQANKVQDSTTSTTGLSPGLTGFNTLAISSKPKQIVINQNPQISPAVVSSSTILPTKQIKTDNTNSVNIGSVLVNSTNKSSSSNSLTLVSLVVNASTTNGGNIVAPASSVQSQQVNLSSAPLSVSSTPSASLVSSSSNLSNNLISSSASSTPSIITSSLSSILPSNLSLNSTQQLSASSASTSSTPSQSSSSSSPTTTPTTTPTPTTLPPPTTTTTTTSSQSSISLSQSLSSSTTAQSAASYPQQSLTAIYTAITQSQQLTQQQPMDIIFSRLPNQQQLKDLILTADSYALLKTIQQVTESGLNCEEKICYLSEFLGRIQAAVVIKNVTLGKLSIVIQAAQGQVKRLVQQIQKNNDNVSKLGLDSLKKKLNDGLDQLTQAYNNYNIADAKLAPKNASILTSQSNIQSYKKKVDSARQQIPTKKLQLTDVTNLIADLQQQLIDAKAKKSTIEAYLLNLNKTITANQKNIDVQELLLDQLDKQMKNIQDQIDRTKSKYKILEVDVQRLRSQIAQKDKKSSQYSAIIADLNIRLSAQKKKIDLNVQSKLKSYINDLQNLLPAIHQKIDQTNYRCNEIKQLQTLTLRSTPTVLYLITPRDFSSYIQSSYNISQPLPNLKPIKTALMSTSILDSSWQNALGITVNSDIIPKQQTDNFTFIGDFTCLQPQGLQTGTGIVSAVNKKFIQVTNGNVKYKLNLAACSRLQLTQEVPQVGQKIYFRGRKVSQLEYNVYKASCF